jgi:hypothetical protein
MAMFVKRWEQTSDPRHEPSQEPRYQSLLGRVDWLVAEELKPRLAELAPLLLQQAIGSVDSIPSEMAQAIYGTGEALRADARQFQNDIIPGAREKVHEGYGAGYNPTKMETLFATGQAVRSSFI